MDWDWTKLSHDFLSHVIDLAAPVVVGYLAKWLNELAARVKLGRLQTVTSIMVQAAMQTLDKVDRPAAKLAMMARLQVRFPGIEAQLIEDGIEAAVLAAKQAAMAAQKPVLPVVPVTITMAPPASTTASELHDL